jgi:hypothetical protein
VNSKTVDSVGVDEIDVISRRQDCGIRPYRHIHFARVFGFDFLCAWGLAGTS